MTVILGINAYHADSSACLLRDGDLIAAAEEERFRRIKHWSGFPSEAIRYCLEAANTELDGVSHVAINTNPRANLFKKIGYALSQQPDPRLVMDRIRNARRRMSIRDELKGAFPGQHFLGRVRHIEHHLAHLASCFLVSPFEEAAAVSVDGFGDFASAAWGLGAADRVSVDDRVLFPHSLGVFYQAMTQYLGFPSYGDEYKVMGLAPYGEPRFLDEMRRIVRLEEDGKFSLDECYFRHVTERIDYRWDNGEPTLGRLYTRALEELLGPARSPEEPIGDRDRDLARSVQAMYEEAFFHLLEAVHERYRTEAVTLAGGCAMNSVANGKVTRRTPFTMVYVQSAAADAGGAIGAAAALWHELEPSASRFAMDHAYWGPAFSNESIGEILDASAGPLESAQCSVERLNDEGALCRRAAQTIADGRVVGWFQGRMEWGPRALGNRSILGDPRRADMKDILNAKIKRRESFRPFAPSILREAVPDWFELDDDVPFMMKVLPIFEERRAEVPAVTHVDGTGRLQTVRAEQNPRYYRLIEAFRILTGVPMVLNTSFNENEPVVCRPEEALDCFLRTNMDVLVMGDWIVERYGTAANCKSDAAIDKEKCELP